MSQNRIKLVLVCFLTVYLLPAAVSGNEVNTDNPDELQFREVLYYFYQQQYQTALTYLDVLKHESASGQLDRLVKY